MLKDSLFKKKPYAALPRGEAATRLREQLGICSAAVSGQTHTHPVCLREATGLPSFFCTKSSSACPGAALPCLPPLPCLSQNLALLLLCPLLAFPMTFQGSSKKENSLCWPLTCEELLVKPTAHPMAGISCARSTDGWRCLSPLSAPIFTMCVVVEGFAPILLIKEKGKCVYYC